MRRAWDLGCDLGKRTISELMGESGRSVMINAIVSDAIGQQSTYGDSLVWVKVS